MSGSRRRRLRQTVSAVSVLWCCAVSPPGASCQTRPPSPRESFRFDAPLVVAKQLENIRGLIEQEQWLTALDALAELQDRYGDALVEVEAGHYRSAADAVRSLLAGLPPPGLEAYRLQVDAWARQQYQLAVRTRSDRALQLLLKDAFASSFGDDALWTLGEWCWDRGDTQAARHYWEQLVAPEQRDPQEARRPSYPDSQYPPAAVLARLVLCSIVERSPQRTAREIEEFTRRYPDSEGTLAGRTGVLRELLDDVREQSRDWNDRTMPGEWRTFARVSSRNAAINASASLEGPQWTIPIAPIEVPHWERPRPALEMPAPLARFPVAVEGGLFFHDGASIRAVRLADGRPRWPVNEASNVGDIYPPSHVLPIRPVLRPTVGIPRFTTTLHRGRLFALTGPSVLTLPESGLRASPTWLVCLDVGREEGLLQWFRTADELFPPGWTMAGTPVASGDRMFLPLLRSEPQLEPAVACLSAEDGTVIWLRSIGQALVEPLRGRVELGHQLLTVCGELVYFATDLGAIAALDAHSGVVRWAVTYASSPPPPLERSEEGARGLTPPVHADGRILAKPGDSPDLMALDAQTGARLWSRRLPGRVVHLLGARDADLIVSGDQLWAVDAATGNVRWRFGWDDPAGSGFGRGLVCGERVFWTTRDDLFVINRLTGQAVQRYPLQEILGVSGGNLMAVDDRLIISGPDHITAFQLTPTRP